MGFSVALLMDCKKAIYCTYSKNNQVITSFVFRTQKRNISDCLRPVMKLDTYSGTSLVQQYIPFIFSEYEQVSKLLPRHASFKFFVFIFGI